MRVACLLCSWIREQSASSSFVIPKRNCYSLQCIFQWRPLAFCTFIMYVSPARSTTNSQLAWVAWILATCLPFFWLLAHGTDEYQQKHSEASTAICKRRNGLYHKCSSAQYAKHLERDELCNVWVVVVKQGSEFECSAYATSSQPNISESISTMVQLLTILIRFCGCVYWFYYDFGCCWYTGL